MAELNLDGKKKEKLPDQPDGTPDRSHLNEGELAAVKDTAACWRDMIPRWKELARRKEEDAAKEKTKPDGASGKRRKVRTRKN